MDRLQLIPSFTDTIADGTVFIPGSVIVNNTVLPAADPNIGFSIPNVAAGQMTTITFQVSVTNLPTVNPTPNTANIVYDFIFNPDFAPIQNLLLPILLSFKLMMLISFHLKLLI